MSRISGQLEGISQEQLYSRLFFLDSHSMPSLSSVSLLILSTSLISSCLAQRPLTSRGMVPLSDEIPSCAQCCVHDFIHSQYPRMACSNLTDGDCLCRTNSTSGFSLGEAALRCTIASCPQDVISGTKALYICDSVPGALRETHSVITATIIATKTSLGSPTPSSRRCPLPTASAPSSTMSTTGLATSFPATSTMFTTTTTTPTVNSRSSVTLAASASSNSASASPSHLSKPAVVGISVAAGVAGLALVSIVIFFCIRKIKQRRRDSDGFEIGGAMAEPPEFLYASMRNSGLGQGRYPKPDGGKVGPQPQPQLGSPFQPASRGPLVVVTTPTVCSMAPGGLQNVGMAISPATDNGDSPMSQVSRRTLSQLLPDKPDYTLDPGQPNTRQNGVRPESNATVFEEDVERSKRSSGWPMPAGSTARNRFSGTMPFHPDSIRGHALRLQADPRALMYAKERQQNGLPAVRRVIQRNPVVYRTSSQLLKPTGDGMSQSQPGPIVQRHVSKTGSIHSDGQWRGSRRWSRPPSCTASSRRCSECSETSFEDEEVPSSSSLTVPKQQLTPVEEVASSFSTPEKQKQRSHVATGSPERYFSPRRDVPPPAEPVAQQLDGVPMYGNQSSGREQSGPESTSHMDHPHSGFLLHPRTERVGTNHERRNANTENKSRGTNSTTNMESKPGEQDLSRGYRAPRAPSNVQGSRGPQVIRNLTPSRHGSHLILSVD
ncbi:hypothetical protein DTO169E5_8659 [Paecilomyces variotii]|nr:hypothetical protein DTO169E5_8659 [Paecilomyces variotii]